MSDIMSVDEMYEKLCKGCKVLDIMMIYCVTVGSVAEEAR